jgi:hypothetical protein
MAAEGAKVVVAEINARRASNPRKSWPRPVGIAHRRSPMAIGLEGGVVLA